MDDIELEELNPPAAEDKEEKQPIAPPIKAPSKKTKPSIDLDRAKKLINHLLKKLNESNAPDARANILQALEKYKQTLEQLLTDEENADLFANIHSLCEKINTLNKKQTHIAANADHTESFATFKDAQEKLGSLPALEAAYIGGLSAAKKIEIKGETPVILRTITLQAATPIQTATIAHKEEKSGVFRVNIFFDPNTLSSLKKIKREQTTFGFGGMPGTPLMEWALKVVDSYYNDPKSDGVTSPIEINGAELPKHCVEALMIAARYRNGNRIDLIHPRHTGDLTPAQTDQAYALFKVANRQVDMSLEGESNLIEEIASSRLKP